MSAIDALLAGPLAAMTVGGVVLAGLGAVCARVWLGEQSPEADVRRQPPLTFLRPVKRGVPGLRERLEALAAAMRAGDQLVLGADAGSPELTVCEAMRAAMPERDIVVVVVVVACTAGAALNPKISKLLQMDVHARHAHFILSDSEARMDAAWLDAFRGEWAVSGADAITAPYRFIDAATPAQCADAAATLLTLWPGLALVRALGQVRFTLGACSGLRRVDLESVGGWAAFGDYLAEDNRLGAELAARRLRIRLSVQVATLQSDPISWRESWLHQRRVAVTYRVSEPRGFAGSIATHGVTAGFFMLLLAPFSASPGFWTCWAFATVGLRWLITELLARVVRIEIPHLWRASAVAGVTETACWFLSWFRPIVWWAGAWRKVAHDGRMRNTSIGA